eukprot:COSAG05_NODE_3729_length_1877_cov_13.088563_1_plen_452_part_10
MISGETGWNDVPCTHQFDCFACEFHAPRQQNIIADNFDPATNFYCNLEQLLDAVANTALGKSDIHIDTDEELAGPQSCAASKVAQDAKVAAKRIWTQEGKRSQSVMMHIKALARIGLATDPCTAEAVSDLQSQLGMMLVSINRNAEASLVFGHCITNPWCQYGKAWMRILQHRDDEAWQELSKVDESEDVFLTSTVVAANALLMLRKGDPEGAVSVLRTAGHSAETVCLVAVASFLNGDTTATAQTMNLCARELTNTTAIWAVNSKTKSSRWLANAQTCAASASMAAGDRTGALETLQIVLSETLPDFVPAFLATVAFTDNGNGLGDTAQKSLKLLKGVKEIIGHNRRPQAVVAVQAMLQSKNKNIHEDTLKLFAELWKDLQGWQDTVRFSDPLGMIEIRYTYARVLREHAQQQSRQKQYFMAGLGLVQATNLLSGMAADFSRDALVQQCEV